MYKYGVRYSSIKYWQDYSVSHVRYNGKRQIFAQVLRSAVNNAIDPRTIARAAISCAAVCSTTEVKSALQG